MNRFSALIFLLLMIGTVAAQGPDVIVGDIPSAANYTADASHDAFAVGTTSCNIGNQVLAWVFNTNQHPVIGSTLYRYDGSRFQMIGQSWLKHGFTALQQSLCGACTPNPSGGDGLGIGCSDPYGAALNGSQSGLGPKFEVNSSSGYFPYPPTNPSYSGNTARRLRVALPDLSVANASYIVEAQYIHPQDALGNNDNNNASYREVAINGGPTDYFMTMGAGTVQMQPAIMAWQVKDPSVSIQTFEVPGASGGQFIVAATRRPAGAGTWHYEYVVHNLNCDASGASFTVNMPSGTTITNAGFASPEYHSGEPFNNNPWVAAVGSNGVTWTVDQTFAQNPNANALRWGTSFNFWFDADDNGPTGSSVGLFKTTGSATFGAPTFPVESWQVNQTMSYLDTDGVNNTPYNGPIIAQKQPGAAGQFNFGSSAPGLPFDVAATAAASAPQVLTTPSGQIVNINLLDPSFIWAYNNFTLNTPGSIWNFPFNAPSGTVTLAGQLVVIDAAHPDGFALSAPNEVRVMACISAGPQALTLGDDDSVQINLGTSSYPCVSSVSVGGTSFTSVYVNSNGSVGLGVGNTDFSPTGAEFTAQEPRLAMFWSDFDPTLGGSITAETLATGVLVVDFVNVREWGTIFGRTFSAEFDSATGDCAISNYTPGTNHTTDTLVGFNPVSGSTGAPRLFSGFAGSGVQTTPGVSGIYQFVSGGAPTGFTRIEFPGGTGTNFVVY